jgi:hypothetical protein
MPHNASGICGMRSKRKPFMGSGFKFSWVITQKKFKWVHVAQPLSQKRIAEKGNIHVSQNFGDYITFYQESKGGNQNRYMQSKYAVR